MKNRSVQCKQPTGDGSRCTQKTRSKNADFGRHNGTHTMEAVAIDIPTEDMLIDNDWRCWHPPEDPAREQLRQELSDAYDASHRAYEKHSRVLDEAMESGNTQASNPDILDSRVEAIRATVHELTLQDELFSNSMKNERRGRKRYSSAEEIPVVVCNYCGAVDEADETHPAFDDNTGARMDVSMCPICVTYRDGGIHRNAQLNWPAVARYT